MTEHTELWRWLNLGETNIDLVRIFGGGKVTIPREIRENLKLKDGDYLAVTFDKKDSVVSYSRVNVQRISET